VREREGEKRKVRGHRERESRGEMEEKGSGSRVIGLRLAAKAASSSLYSSFEHYFSSPFSPVNPTHPVSSHTLHFPPFSPSLFFSLTPSFTTLIQSTFCPLSPSQVSCPSLPTLPFLSFAYSTSWFVFI